LPRWKREWRSLSRNGNETLIAVGELQDEANTLLDQEQCMGESRRGDFGEETPQRKNAFCHVQEGEAAGRQLVIVLQSATARGRLSGMDVPFARKLAQSFAQPAVVEIER